MKTNIYVEFKEKQVNEADLIKAAKSLWTKSGKKIGEITSLRLYIKPEDSAAYVVINESFQAVIML